MSKFNEFSVHYLWPWHLLKRLQYVMYFLFNGHNDAYSGSVAAVIDK